MAFRGEKEPDAARFLPVRGLKSASIAVLFLCIILSISSYVIEMKDFLGMIDEIVLFGKGNAVRSF